MQHTCGSRVDGLELCCCYCFTSILVVDSAVANVIHLSYPLFVELVMAAITLFILLYLMDWKSL